MSKTDPTYTKMLLGYVFSFFLFAAGFFITFPQQKLTINSPSVLGVSVDIPSTNYSIPGGAIFMSPTGNDANSGTQGSPVKTLSRAVSLSPSSGGTVVLRGGLYRDGRSSNLAKSITFQAYPGEKPWLDGTDIVTSWTDDGDGKWSVAWDTPTFCSGSYNSFNGSNFDAGAGGPCHHPDQSLDPGNLMAWDPQMVFKNDNYVRQVSSRAEATGDAFYYDRSLKRIVLGFNPGGHTVELAARAQALYIENGSPIGGGVKGIGFKRFATNEYNGNRTHGALLVNVEGYTLENSVFTLMAGAGASFANPKNAVIRSNYFVSNGFNGLDGNGKKATSGQTDNTLIENNVFQDNNTEDFGTGCSASCAAAGSKFAHMAGMTVKNNIFESNNGSGFWCDLYCTNVKIINNVARNNTKSGLYYEVSDNGIIASNLVVGNSGEGIKSGSATTRIYNNTAANNGVGFLIYDDSRAASGSEIAPETTQVDFINNIVYGGSNIVRVYNGQTNANQIFSNLNRNAYYRPSGSPARFIEWRTGGAPTPTYNSVSAFTAATGYDANSFDITTGADPFFVNAAGSDYRIRSDSQVFRIGTTIPSDIATLIGVSATNQDLGALIYPGVGPTISPPAPPPPPPAPTPSPVSPPAAPQISTFSATPASVEQGNRSTLSWASTNTTSCDIQTSDSSISVGTSATWQTPTLSALGIRTYTLVCKNSAEVTTSQVITVTVTAPLSKPGKPTINGTKTSVKLNESFAVSWSSSGASSCTLEPGTITASGTTGSRTIGSISANTTYIVTCSNTVGSTASDGLTIAVDTTTQIDESTLPAEEKKILITADNQTIANAAATETVGGDAVLDPTIVTNVEKQANVVKVEYYDGEKLIYTASEPPYALDTTLLANGTYTITARTYLKDGTTEEITRVLGVENELPEVSVNNLVNGPVSNSKVATIIAGILMVCALSMVSTVAGVYILYKKYPLRYALLRNRLVNLADHIRNLWNKLHH